MTPGGGGPRTRTIIRITVTVAGTALLLYLLYRVRSVLILVFIAGFLALALGPAVEFFARRGLPRGFAILATYLVILAAIVGVGSLIVPPVVSGVNGLSHDIPHYIQDLEKSKQFRRYDRRYHISQKLNQQAKKLPSRLGEAAGALQSVTVGVFSAIVQLITVLTMTFFLLRDGGRIFGWMAGLLGPRQQRYEAVAGDIYRSVSGYVAGNLVISIIAGTVAYIALSVLGVPFAVPLAVLVAFLDLVPLVGATLGSIVVGIVTLFHDFPTATIVWTIVTVVYQQIENNVLQPVIYRRTVDVPPLLVIIAILIGGSLLGVLGALVAIPIAAALQIIARDAWRYRAGEPILPAGAEGST